MKLFLELFMRERRPGDLVFAALFFVISLLLAAVLPSQAQFVANTKTVAQPAFWPLVGLTMMVGFGAIHLASSINSPRIRGRLKEVFFWIRSLEFVGWFMAYVWVIPELGYLLSSIVFVVLLSVRLGYRGWIMLGSGALFAICIVLIFKTGLGVALPTGAIYSYLPDSIRNFMMVNF